MTRRPKHDWDGRNGTMYAFELKFDDATIGLANAKSESPWYKVNDDVAVTIRGERNGFAQLKIESPDFAKSNSSARPSSTGSRPQADGDFGVVVRWAIDAAIANSKDVPWHIDTIREQANQFIRIHNEMLESQRKNQTR